MNEYKNKNGEQMKALQVGPKIWLLVSSDKATPERAEEFKKDCERSQRLARKMR